MIQTRARAQNLIIYRGLGSCDCEYFAVVVCTRWYSYFCKIGKYRPIVIQASGACVSVTSSEYVLLLYYYISTYYVLCTVLYVPIRLIVELWVVWNLDEVWYYRSKYLIRIFLFSIVCFEKLILDAC